MVLLLEEEKLLRKSTVTLRNHIAWLGACILFIQILTLAGISYAFAQ